jgi:hypothetical protein
LGFTAAGVLVAEDLLSTKTFFLPPANGWFQGYRMREVRQYDINNDWMPTRFDVVVGDVSDDMLPSYREIAQHKFNEIARRYGLIHLPQVTLPLPKTAVHAVYT